MTKVQVQKIHSLIGHRDCVYTICQADEGNLFFSGAGDGMVVLWDLHDGNVGEKIAQLPNSIFSLHYSHQKDLLIAGHNYEGIHLLDWRNKKEISSLQLTSSAIFDIQSFGNNLLVATGDGTVVIADIDQLTIRKRLTHSQRSARAIAINPGGGEFAVGYSDNHIRVFDLENYSMKTEWAAHANSVFTLGYTPDYKILLSGSRDAHLKAWDVGAGYDLKDDIAAHLFAINHLVFSPDGKHFVTCSMDKSIKVWDTRKRQLLKVIDKARHAGHGTSVNKLLWTSFNSQLISASDDRSISVWDLFFNLPQTENK